MSEDTSINPVPRDRKAETPIEFDATDYQHHLQELDLSDQQKHELLESLWHIMSTFVNIGWGVDTVQILLPDMFSEANDEELANEAQGTLDSDGDADLTGDSTKTRGTTQ